MLLSINFSIYIVQNKLKSSLGNQMKHCATKVCRTKDYEYNYK